VRTGRRPAGAVEPEWWSAAPRSPEGRAGGSKTAGEFSAVGQSDRRGDRGEITGGQWPLLAAEPPGVALPRTLDRRPADGPELSDTCPTGVATQNQWLTRGLDPPLKSQRAANYIKTLRRDLYKVAQAAGLEHPSLHDPDSAEIIDHQTRTRTLRKTYDYRPRWGSPSRDTRHEIEQHMTSPRADT
jgi:hypothetical protein